MNWDAIGAVGEIVGALAVLITLIYLARQVTHARREQQIAAFRANRDERRQFFEALRDSPYMPSILCKLQAGEPLEPEDQLRWSTHKSLAWSILYSEWVQSQLDLKGEFSPDFDVTLEFSMRLPGMVEWFHDMGTRLYPASFRSHVERVQQRLAQT